MGDTRRHFLKTSAAAAAGLAGVSGVVRAAGDGIVAPITGELIRAERGAMVQVVAPPPPPPVDKWDPGDFVMRVDGFEGQKMAFTFDDGPSPANTYAVLRALEAGNAKATFFLVGVNVRAYPQIARDIVSAGHELGNHSVYHTPYRSAALANQIASNNSIIEAETGVRPVVHRAPGLTRGSSILYVCQQQQMYEVHTRMGTSDWVSPRWSASRLIGQFSSNLSNGAIPIYHDGGPGRPTRAAVSSMVSIARSRGYECVTATDLVNSGSPLPGTMSYPALGTRVLTAAGAEPEPEHTHDDGVHIDCCQFDVRESFVARLDDVDVTAAERSRIVEQLAMLDEHQLEHAG